MRCFLRALVALILLSSTAFAQNERIVMYAHGVTAFAPLFVGGSGVSPGTDGSAMEQTAGFGWCDIVGLRNADGPTSTGKQGAANVFIGTPATPVPIDGARYRIEELALLRALDDGAEVSDVEIHDGSRRIWRTPRFNRTGPLTLTSKTADKTFRPTGSTEFWNGGLAVRVHVRFRMQGRIRFEGLGAHFVK